MPEPIIGQNGAARKRANRNDLALFSFKSAGLMNFEDTVQVGVTMSPSLLLHVHLLFKITSDV